MMGIGDWGLGIGDWGFGPIPNPQSPIPNPQSPIPNPQSPYYNFNKKYLIIYNFISFNLYFYYFIILMETHLNTPLLVRLRKLEIDMDKKIQNYMNLEKIS